MPAFPDRTIFTCRELSGLWHMSGPEIRDYIIHGKLRAHMWLPATAVNEVSEESDGQRMIVCKTLRHWSGYSMLLCHDCRTLFNSGKAYIRSFMSDDGLRVFELPDGVNNLKVLKQDLIVLNSEKTRFETECGLCSGPIPQPSGFPGGVKILGRIGRSAPETATIIENNFRKIRYKGIDFRLGEIQAAVLRMLYEAHVASEPWQSGKVLLQKAGSQSFGLLNVFKHNPHWREIITSDGRGCYRLNEDFAATIRTPEE